MKEVLEDIYKKIEQDHEKDYFLFHKERYLKLLNILSEYSQKDNVVLDIGSAYNHILEALFFKGYTKLHAVDFKHVVDSYNSCEELPKIDFRACDLSVDKLPFEEDVFDLAMMTETLEHFNFHPLSVFEEVNRVLKDGGFFIVTTPNLIRLNNRIKLLIGQSVNSDIKKPYREGTHHREYNMNEISYLFNETGFNVVLSNYDNFDYPANSLLRIFNKILPKIKKSFSGNIVAIGQKISKK